MSAPWSIFLAFTAYSVLHSLLASRRVKRAVRQALDSISPGGRMADRFYRLFFNLVGILTLLPVLYLVARFPGEVLYSLRSAWLFLALGIQVLGVVLLLIGVAQTDPWHFLGVRQIVEPGVEEHQDLVVRGLYRIVRHPLYFAGLLFLWATPVMTTGILAFNLAASAYLYVGSLFEERRLVAAFGQTYRDYQKRVPRLIPNPWRGGSGTAKLPPE
jgi:protein-S-isoprenylcysteine O-methyltransferase Ste14